MALASYDWQPRYVQAGAHWYPLSIPETRSIALWALTRPNIGAVQTFHNSGGMILRIPGAKSHPRLTGADRRAYDLIGEQGERILPGYDYMLSCRDLYTTHGATDDHFFRVDGGIGYTNELYEAPTDFDGDGESTPTSCPSCASVTPRSSGWTRDCGGWRYRAPALLRGRVATASTHHPAARTAGGIPRRCTAVMMTSGPT